jgi:hypothetical protein
MDLDDVFRRFLAAGGTQAQLAAYADKMGTAIEFGGIVDEGRPQVYFREDEMPPAAFAVLEEWWRDVRRRNVG